MRYLIPAFACLAVLLVATDDARAAGGPPPDPAAAEAEHDPGAAAVKAGRAFLKTLAAGEDHKAHAMTTPAYRAAWPVAAFLEEAAKVRKAGSLAPTPQLEGWVLLKPGEGEPRRALLTTVVSSRTPSARGKKGARAGGPPPTTRPAMVGLELHEVDGRWLVAGVTRDVYGLTAEHFTEPVRRSAGKEGIAVRVSSTIAGEIARAGGTSVAVKPFAPTAPKESPARAAQTLAVDEKTEVVVYTLAGERTLPDGQTIRSFNSRPGTFADLKPGCAVTVHPSADDNPRADRVEVVARDDGL